MFDRTSRFKSQIVRLMILEFAPDFLLLTMLAAIAILVLRYL